MGTRVPGEGVRGRDIVRGVSPGGWTFTPFAFSLLAALLQDYMVVDSFQRLGKCRMESDMVK